MAERNETYRATFSRNIGFVSDAEQEKLARATVLILGVGGMGGAALESLVRSGVGSFILADPDHFELHNLNRQVFSDQTLIGQSKVEAARDQAQAINPQACFELHETLSGAPLQEAVCRADVVINGCDDPRASIELHRAAGRFGKTAIDAMAAAFPNVVVATPGSGGTEKLFGSPTRTRALDALTAADVALYSKSEIQFVLVQSTSSRHLDLPATREFIRGERKRFSFAPMVITTGNLMAFEAIRVILKRKTLKNGRVHAYFFNPWTQRIEKIRRGPASWPGMVRALRFFRRISRPL